MVDPLIPRDDINAHNFESNPIKFIFSLRGTFHPLSSTSHGFLYLYFLDQSNPSTIASDTHDFQFSSPNGNGVEGDYIS